jgi:hypothetical protein
MGIDDLVNQGKDFLEKNKDQIEQTLKSDQAEEVSDKALDAAAATSRHGPQNGSGNQDRGRSAVNPPYTSARDTPGFATRPTGT